MASAVALPFQRKALSQRARGTNKEKKTVDKRILVRVRVDFLVTLESLCAIEKKGQVRELRLLKYHIR